jgi:large conductance mechanosensitive channel
MLKGFRDFLFRGNIVDLAVAVVIGTAFTALVTGITDALIQPLVNLFLGGGVDGGKVIVNDQTFDFGAVVNALITFVIIAAVVYFLIMTPMKRIMERAGRGESTEDTPAPTDEALLLTEIRDLMQRQVNQMPPRDYQARR